MEQLTWNNVGMSVEDASLSDYMKFPILMVGELILHTILSRMHYFGLLINSAIQMQKLFLHGIAAILDLDLVRQIET